MDQDKIAAFLMEYHALIMKHHLYFRTVLGGEIVVRELLSGPKSHLEDFADDHIGDIKHATNVSREQASGNYSAESN